MRSPPHLVVATSLTVIAVLTLTPAPDTDTASWLTCIFCGERATADAVRNILLFAPLGVGLRLMHLSERKAIAFAMLLSGSVELLQLVIPGRDASVGDLLSNSVGCMLGISLVVSSRWWMFPSATTGCVWNMRRSLRLRISHVLRNLV